MRICLVLVLLVAACKEKQEAKPAPTPTPTPTPTVVMDAAAAEAPIPVEPKPAIKPAGGLNTAEEYETKALDLTDKLTAVFAGSGTNCAKLAHNLEVFLEDNKQAFTSTDAFELANPSAQDDLEPKMQQKARVLLEKVTFSLQACGKNERVKAAMAKLPD